MSGGSIELKFAKGDKTFVASFDLATATVGDLRSRVAKLTGVPTHQQKLAGLTKGTVRLDDDVLLSTLKLKPNQRIVVFKTENAQNAQQPIRAVVNNNDAESEEALLRVRSVVDALSERVDRLSSVSERRSVDAELERQLLALDAISSQSEAVREARRVEVRRIQAILDKLDAMAAAAASSTSSVVKA